jgi:hypothetical protein
VSTSSTLPEDFAVARLKRVDVAALLQRLSLTEVIDAGGVNVISLDAIRERAGERWPRKQADVWAHIERCMAKILAPQDVVHRLTDCDYLVAIVSDSPVAAQALCMNILEETLVFFLGACVPSQLLLHTVRGFSDGVLDCHTVDARYLRQRSEGVDPAKPQQRAAQAITPIMTFQSTTGRDLVVSHGPLFLTSLRQGVHAGVRSEPAVVDKAANIVLPRAEVARLADADLARIDQATLERCIAVSRVVQSDRPGMIVPLSFQTLSSSRSRAALFALAPADFVRQRFLIEIINIDAGTPNGRLRELVGLLRAHTTGVLARVPPSRGALDVLRDIRLAGVALDLSDSTTNVAAVMVAMTAFYNRAVGLAPSLQVLGLNTKAMFGPALKCGMTHASLRKASPLHLAA